MAREKICGIYRIENLVNHKNYIGQSIDVYDRWIEHKWGLNNERHNNQHLLRSWHKYGEDNFEFTIVEICNKNELNEREIYWIDYYDAYYHGYNQTKGGDGCLGKIWTDDEREQISRAVLQINLNGDIVRRFINIDDASKHTGINNRQIWNCANKHQRKYKRNGKIYSHLIKTAGGYIWVYEDEYDNFDLSCHTSNTISYAVYQYDIHWNLIKIWPSAESIKSDGYQPTVVRSVCQGKFMTAYGFLWSYEVEDLDEYIVWFKDHFDVQYIGQYTISGELINVWNTPVETEQDGFRACSVRECLRGNQFVHKGYTFKYIQWRELEKINWKGQLNYGK